MAFSTSTGPIVIRATDIDVDFERWRRTLHGRAAKRATRWRHVHRLEVANARWNAKHWATTRKWRG